MPSKHLTQRVIDALRTDKSQLDVLDTSIRLRGIAFGIRVTQSGRKEFFCRYRDRMNKRRRLSLGDAGPGGIGLAKAHERLREVASRLHQSKDASEERDARKAAISFPALCQEYLRLHAIRKKDRGKADEQAIARTLYPRWGRMKASEIRRRDVIVLLDEIGVEQEKPCSANKIRGLISVIFSFGLRRELIETTPCTGLPKKFPEPPRERFLTDEEIVKFWQATAGETPAIRDLFRLLLLLGQRSGEVKAMAWTELRDGVWYIPGSRTKNGKEHVVPLPPVVLSILEPHRAAGHLGVFVARGASSIKWLRKAQCRIADRMKSVPPWTTHDLRRTCATGMEEIGIDEVVIASVLNHSKRSRQGVTAIYARHRYLKEKGEALVKWCDHVVHLVKAAEASLSKTSLLLERESQQVDQVDSADAQDTAL